MWRLRLHVYGYGSEVSSSSFEGNQNIYAGLRREEAHPSLEGKVAVWVVCQHLADKILSLLEFALRLKVHDLKATLILGSA